MAALQSLEIELIQWVQSLGVWLVMPMKASTFLGSVEFYLLIMPAVYWCYDTALGLQMGCMLMLSAGLNQALKLVFHRPRPYWLPAGSERIQVWTHAKDFAMPSGHAQHAASLWGLVARFLNNRWAGIAAVGLALCIGLSRVYLGVHFPSDVLGGWLVGALLLWACLRLREPLTQRLRAMSFGGRVVAALISSAAVLGLNLLSLASLSGWQVPEAWYRVALARTGEPITPVSLSTAFELAGVLLGLGCGAAWLAQTEGFCTAGSLFRRVTRYLLGVIGVGVLWFGLKAVLPHGDGMVACSLGLLRSAAVGVWVAAGAPLVFRRLGLA